mmetsp:Transcript_161/g.429  ORF Transcript_161/g.429 Transcript_161/m.429 type:complete len:409 (+) Transcript_161:748-1974(+)
MAVAVDAVDSQPFLPLQAVSVGALVVKGVLEEAADLLAGHGHRRLAEIVVAAPGCQESRSVRVGARLHDLSEVVQRHLVVTGHEPQVPVIDEAGVRTQNPAHAGVGSEAAVSDGEALEVPRHGWIGIGIVSHHRRTGPLLVLEDPPRQRRDVDSPVGFSRQVQVVGGQAGELRLEEGLEGRVGVERAELVRPGDVPAVVAGGVRVVVVAVAEPDRRRLIDHQQAAQPRPRVRIVDRRGDPRFAVGIRLEALVGEHQGTDLREEPEERRGSRPAVRPVNQGKIASGRSLLLVFRFDQDVMRVDPVALQVVFQVPGVPGRRQGLVEPGKEGHPIGMIRCPIRAAAVRTGCRTVIIGHSRSLPANGLGTNRRRRRRRRKTEHRERDDGSGGGEKILPTDCDDDWHDCDGSY